MQDRSIQSIIIVGGGTSGWMSAAILAKKLGPKCRVTLIESDEIGTVGVGEATIPSIRHFNDILELDEFDFVKSTNGTFKLGIDFVNWGKIGNRYFHPFGGYGPVGHSNLFHHQWIKAHLAGNRSSLDDYSVSWSLAKNSKFIKPHKDKAKVLAAFNYAYHFDAHLYAKYMRNHAENLGVRRVEGKISRVEKDGESGFVSGLRLEAGDTHRADFYIDCSGLRALLIEGALETGFEDWSKWLPCDTALALPTSGDGRPPPYTVSTAMSSGWKWRIPLQSRVGNGYVHASDFISAKDAEDEFLGSLNDKRLADVRKINFKAGVRKRAWNKNVLSVGLSSGFLEPLESTSIHLVSRYLLRLLALFPDLDFDQKNIDRFNRECDENMVAIRDFVIMHYHLSERDDTEFWRYCRDMSIPTSLQDRLDYFKSTSRVEMDPDPLFGANSWIAVQVGQGHLPLKPEALSQFDNFDAEAFLRRTQQIVGLSTQRVPLHHLYIDKFCKSDPSEGM